ncbi:MAG: GNAT family N-acetyltransferase, partial [Bacillota bacterium]
KPTYEGESIELVAVDTKDEVVGFLDIEIEQRPGSLCLHSEHPRGAFAWEFGVVRRLWGRGLGTRMVRRAEQLLAAQYDVHYVEWWSTDRRSQKWYERYGMECIDTHWRFTVRDVGAADCLDGEVRLVNALLTCPVDTWAKVRGRLDVITTPPLEPRLCRGYAHRF